MDTIFMNSKNSETFDPNRLLLSHTDKINLKRSDKMFLYQTLAFTVHGKSIKKSYKNNTFKISAPIWLEEFEWSDRSYSVSDIRNYFEYSLKKYGEKLMILR